MYYLFLIFHSNRIWRTNKANCHPLLIPKFQIPSHLLTTHIHTLYTALHYCTFPPLPPHSIMLPSTLGCQIVTIQMQLCPHHQIPFQFYFVCCSSRNGSQTVKIYQLEVRTCSRNVWHFWRLSRLNQYRNENHILLKYFCFPQYIFVQIECIPYI